MDRRSLSTGFTLIEVLIVVALIAVLAATLIPQFSSSAQDAKESSLKYDLKSLRTQIDMYKLDHGGQPPSLSAGTLAQLNAATNASGGIGTPGPSFPYGPYMMNAFPPNPITGIGTVTAMTAYPPTAETGNGGWQYDATTGRIAADSAKYLTW
jgi:prepilin-type N-terminal cleavage/methylation domain-containing protein